MSACARVSQAGTLVTSAASLLGRTGRREHVRHEDAGPLGHQREVGLVLDLLQAVHDESGSRIPVDGKTPQFGQHPGVGGVPAVDRQLDRLGLCPNPTIWPQ